MTTLARTLGIVVLLLGLAVIPFTIPIAIAVCAWRRKECG